MKPTRGLAAPALLGALAGLTVGLLLARTQEPPTAGERAISPAMSAGDRDAAWVEVARLLRLNQSLKSENARLRLEARR